VYASIVTIAASQESDGSAKLLANVKKMLTTFFELLAKYVNSKQVRRTMTFSRDVRSKITTTTTTAMGPLVERS
jgi:hypothetical protein